MTKIEKKLRENIDQYLTDYLEKNYATFEFDLIEGRGPKVKIRTISVEQQMEVEDAMKDVDDKAIVNFKLHTYQVLILSKSLLSIGDKNFKTPEDALIYLKDKGSAFTDRLLNVQSEFEKFFKNQLNPEDIENFSQTPSTDTEQN